MVEHVSYSAWQLFRNGCQWRWKLDYADGLRKQNYGIHMDFGTAIHEALEHHKKRKEPIDRDAAIFLFKEKFKKLYDENFEKYKESDRSLDLDFFFKAGCNILTRLDDCKELSLAEVVYNEHALLLPIDRTDDIKINFKGFIDMVIKTKDARGNTILYICDFKTCSWGWPKKKREDKELHFQILLYKHFLCKKFNIDPKFVRTAFILLKKNPSNGSSPIEWFQISAGPVSVQRAVDELNKDISEMVSRSTSDNFVKNKSECVNKFGEVCPYKSSLLCPDK